MRRLKTYPAFASINMPRSAIILDVKNRGSVQAPSLICSVDDGDAETVERRFLILPCDGGQRIPAGATFVASWRNLDLIKAPISCLFELDLDIPEGVAPELVGRYRTLINAGFTLTPERNWRAPDDSPNIAPDHIIAITELQESGGFGDLESDA